MAVEIIANPTDPLDLLRLGGPAVVPLLLGSTAALTLAFERCWFWGAIARRHGPIARHSLTLYRHDRQAAIAHLKTLSGDGSLPVVRLALAPLLEGDRPHPLRFRRAWQMALAAERDRLIRYDTAFRTLATTAPLLGLLGTILGLMDIFSGPAIAPPTQTLALDPDAIAAGIGQALASTAAGLVIAIAALLAGRLFRSLAQRHLVQLQTYGNQLELLYRRIYWHLNIAPKPGPRSPRSSYSSSP
ncbi:MAG: MotA/TolQ/ExbB proton channel family protein [Cyanophyceae cyanobacterium]